MPRTFGPTNAPGTRVIERDAGKEIQPGALGTTVYIGQMEKGSVRDSLAKLVLNDCPNQGSYIRKCGGYIDGSELPNAAFDFYNYGNGAGRLYTVRVTDGLEVEATDFVWSRSDPHGSDYAFRGAGLQAQLLTVTAKNGGRWGGAQSVRTGEADSITETTLTTGVTMLEDVWVGATLELVGVTTKSYRVIANSTAGIVTVESDSTMATDLANEDPGNLNYSLVLDTEERSVSGPGARAGDRKAVSLRWKDGEEDQDNYFGLDILVDGLQVRSYPNLSLDPTNKWSIENLVNRDADNDFIDVVVDYSGTYNAEHRPANFYGQYTSFSGATLGARVWQATYTLENELAGFLVYVDVPSKCVRQRLTLTFSSASAFTITSSAARGLDLDAGIISGTVGTPLTAHNGFIPGLLVVAGEEDFASGDTIVIDVNPFPVEFSTGDGLLSGNVFVDAGSSRVKVAIESNTVDTITFKNNPPSEPTAGTSIEEDAAVTPIGTAISFPFTAAVTLDLVTDDDGLEEISIGSAEYTTIGDLITALNGAVSVVPAFFADGGSDRIGINGALYTTAALNTNVGKASFIKIVAGSADINATADLVITGTTGDFFRVEAATELRGGYDGSDPADSDYLEALNTVLSPVNRLRGRNVGLVKIAIPGVTTTAIQRAGLAYAEFRNYQFRVEIPANITSEASAVNYVNSTIGRNDYGVAALPSYGYVTNPRGAGLILQTLSGAIHGREALVARNFGGFHKASAGQSVTIPHMIESPFGEAALDEETLNPQGIATIKKLAGNFVVWGDRTISVDPGWKWKHQREYMSHIENVLLESFDWLVFAINDPSTQKDVRATLLAFFLPEWQKRALRGATFEEACEIKIDSENNTNATRAAGDLNSEISLRLADTVERFNITIGKLGIFDQIG